MKIKKEILQKRLEHWKEDSRQNWSGILKKNKNSNKIKVSKKNRKQRVKFLQNYKMNSNKR
jgi:hypothetical protein